MLLKTASLGYDGKGQFRVSTLEEALSAYEQLDSQKEVPEGWTSSGTYDQEVVTAGIEVKPIPQVVFKFDYQWLKNEAKTGVNRFNVALGYLF